MAHVGNMQNQSHLSLKLSQTSLPGSDPAIHLFRKVLTKLDGAGQGRERRLKKMEIAGYDTA